MEIYDENQHHPLCRKYAGITEKIIKTILLGYWIGFVIGVCVVLSAQQPLAIPVVYPGIDISHIEGYVVNVILQIMWLLVIVTIWPPFEAMVAVIFLNMSMVSQFLTERIDELQQLLREKQLGREKLAIKSERIENVSGLLREERSDAPTSRQRMLAIISSHIKYNRSVKLRLSQSRMCLDENDELFSIFQCNSRYSNGFFQCLLCWNVHGLHHGNLRNRWNYYGKKLLCLFPQFRGTSLFN